MAGQQVAYRRVSTVLQNEGRQLDEVGIKFDAEFTDKVSGKDRKRPELEACLKHCRKGDTLHIHSIDRLARSLKDLQEIVDELVSKGVTVKFHKGELTFTGEDNPMNKLMLQMMGAFSEFELSIINERRREGQQVAKKNGKHIGRKSSLTAEDAVKVKELWKSGLNKMQIAEDMGVSRGTLYKLIKEHSIELETQNV